MPGPKDEPDFLAYHGVFPDPSGLFYSGYHSLQAIANECIVVLDTNALLAPYSVGREGIQELAQTYRRLVAEKRLIVPAQVAREFAKNRPKKIAELVQALGNKRSVKNHQAGRYPLLAGVSSYEKLVELEKRLDELLNEYRQTIGSVVEHVQGWGWNDPVSTVYGEIFPSCVEEPQIKREDIAARLAYRQINKIPPGYKDSNKEDAGVGDLLIWDTIRAVGERLKRPVLFVSGDVKADWFHRSENVPLFPRFELVDEFRRCSGGQTFHIVQLSKMLELFGVTEETISQVRREERHQSADARTASLGLLVEALVRDWIRSVRPDLVFVPTQNHDLAVTDGGATSGIEIKLFRNTRTNNIRNLARRLTIAPEFDSTILFLIAENADAAKRLAHPITDLLGELPDGVQIVTGRLFESGELSVYDAHGVFD